MVATARLADALAGSLEAGEFPIVLGGDCSILLGTALAPERRGRFGLLFIDGARGRARHGQPRVTRASHPGNARYFTCPMPRFSPCHAGLLAAIVISTAVAVPASAQPCPPLTVGNPDGNYIVPGSKGAIPYAAGLSLDAYVQRGPSRRPSIVVIHGGGWSSGGRAAHVGQILELVTRAGYHWFSLDYRAAGVAKADDSLTDLRAALAFIRCRAGAFGIDPSQLVLLGEDSGAHLAARLAAERPAGVIGAVLLGGFYDLAAVPSLESALRGQDAAALSPARHVTAAVPTLLIHGGADTEAPVEQARRYCGAIEQARGQCRFIEVPGASHRIENWWPSQWSYKQELTGWLAALTPTRTWRHQPRPGAVQKDIVYDRAGRLALDAFVPRRARPTPAIIIVHGGGWEAGDKVTYVTPLFEPLSRAGLAWFSIDYRLTPSFTHDQQIEDVRSAIRFVRDHHRQFNVDPARIFLLGESASGQIATLLAAEDLPLAGVISFYGVYDLEAMVTDASPRSLLVRLFRGAVLDDAARAVLRRYSPIHRARPEMPPLLLINGTGERLWEQAQAYRRRLAAVGARHDAIVLDGAPHGLENWEGRPEWSGYKARLVRWIEEVTAGKPRGGPN